MADSGTPDDFFGASYIGANPNAAGMDSYLNQLTQLHALLSNQAGGFSLPNQTQGMRVDSSGPSTPEMANGGYTGGLGNVYAKLAQTSNANNQSVANTSGAFSGGDFKGWFQQQVAGKPWNQQTLEDLAPLLQASGSALTTPNAAGEKTKILDPTTGQWVRVGFGEANAGAQPWSVWTPQGDSGLQGTNADMFRTAQARTQQPAFNYDGTGIPQDMQQLRATIATYLNQNFSNGSSPQQYPGTFNIGMPIGSEQLFNNASGVVGGIGNMLSPGYDTLNGLMGYSGQTDISPLLGPLGVLLGGGGIQGVGQYSNTGMGYLNQMAKPAGDLASNGGVNAQILSQITPGAMGLGQNMIPGATNLSQGGLGAGSLNAAGGVAQNIAQTGGAPMQQLLSSLQAIQQAGQTNINNNLAQIRESYGKQGLGAGSDVNNALALGATQGQQQIEAQQSSLLTAILQQAAQTQLGGVNALNNTGNALNAAQGAGLSALQGAGQLQLGGYGAMLQGGQNITNAQLGGINALLGASQSTGNLAALDLQAQQARQAGMLGALGTGLNILQTPTQEGLQSAGLNLNAAMGLPVYGNTMLGAYNTSNSGFNSLAGYSQQGNIYGNSQQYTDFLRQIGLTPQQQAALGFATSYPQAPGYGPSTGAQIGSAAITAGSGIATALIIAAAMSDRNMKEDIKPLRVKSVRKKLEKLPISTWRYKGDSTRHIGPMAQDFQKTFGVGDGKMLHLVDVMGVLLQSQKELSKSMRERGV